MSRKDFDKELYETGSEAEIKVMNAINEHPELFEHEGKPLIAGQFLVARNSNKYGVDLLVLIKDENGYYREAFGVEVVRRACINYPTIFVEGNKAKYYKNGLSIMVVVCNFELTKALVLDGDKPITGFPSKISNHNSKGTDELNFLVPRGEFSEWQFEP